MKMRNVVALILTAAMLLALCPAAVAAEGEREIFAELTLDEETEIFIVNGGDVVYLSFTAPETGLYRIYSDSDHDTWGDLYDSEWNLLASHGMEASDYSYDFRIIHELTAGETYYIGARCNSEIITTQGWSSYYVGVEKWSITASEIVLGEKNKIYMPRDTTRYLSFTPEETGYYKFSGYEHMVLIDSRGQKLEEASDELIGRKLTAGETYYLQMNSYWIFWSGNVYVTLERFTDTPSGTCGDLTWSLVDGVLTVSGSGEMLPDDGQWRMPWDEYRTFICEVVIGEGVTSVYERAFMECEELTKVTLPDSLQTIGDYAFCECTGLEAVEMKNVTELGEGAFSGCEALTAIDLPDTLTSCGSNAFQNCTALTDIRLPANSAGLGSGMFRGCTALEKLTVPEGCTDLPSEFLSGCTALAELSLPESLTYIGKEAFSSCYALESVELPDGLEYLGTNAFANCRSLRTIHIPAKTESNWRGTFEGCYSLEEITVHQDNPDVTARDGVLYSKDMTTLICYPMAKVCQCYDVPASVTLVMNRAIESRKIYHTDGDYNSTSGTQVIRFLGTMPEMEEYYTNSQGQTRAFFYINITVSYPEGDETWETGLEYYDFSWADLTFITHSPDEVTPTPEEPVVPDEPVEPEEPEEPVVPDEPEEPVEPEEPEEPVVPDEPEIPDEPEQTGLLGDVNLDGWVDAEDAALIMQYEVGLIGEDQLQLSLADVNADGWYDAEDAALIMQLEVGLIDSF